MADGILSPCNVTRGSGIKILNSPGGSTCNMARGSGMTCHEFAQTSPILEYFWFRFRPLSPQSTCHSAPVCEMLSNSDRPRQKNDVMSNFTIADDTFWFAVILFRSAVHLLSVFVFCRRLLPFTVVFSSSARQPSVVRRQPSTVLFSRHPTVPHRRSTTTSPEVRASTSIEQVPHLSCRKLCYVLSSAGLKKTTSSPSSLGSVSH